MDYDDLDLRPSAEKRPASPWVLPEPDRRRWAPRIAAALLVVAVAITGYLVLRPRGTVTPVAPLPATAADSPSTAPASDVVTESEPVIVPPLDESDDTVRTLVRMLSSNPSVAAWLTTDDLIRNFTTVVTNIANGDPTTKLVRVLKPDRDFAVVERGEDLVMDPRGYDRYASLAAAASSIDPAGAARLYATLKPRIEDAYAELGFPDSSFDPTLEKALVLLLRTPIPRSPVPVEVKGGTSYRFADPALETLTSSQKLLIRFGPENQRTVQASLRNIALAIGIPDSRLR